MKKYVICAALLIAVAAAASSYFLLFRDSEPGPITYTDNGNILTNVSIPVENGSEGFQCVFSGEFQTEDSSGGYVVSDIVGTKFDFKDKLKNAFHYAPLYTDTIETQSHNDGRVTLTQPMELIVNGTAVGDVLAKAEFRLDPASGELSVVSSSAVYTPFSASACE